MIKNNEWNQFSYQNVFDTNINGLVIKSDFKSNREGNKKSSSKEIQFSYQNLFSYKHYWDQHQIDNSLPLN